MGIYLPNMEMPKEGRLTLQISANGAVYVVNSCSITAETYTTEAVPVPPHGRLIDTDAVSLDGGPYEYDEWCKWALDQYQDAPTVIPAEGEEET